MMFQPRIVESRPKAEMPRPARLRSSPDVGWSDGGTNKALIGWLSLKLHDCAML